MDLWKCPAPILLLISAMVNLDSLGINTYVGACNLVPVDNRSQPYQKSTPAVQIQGSRKISDKFEEAFHKLGRNIFLLETSARKYVDSRVACAIESAARQNPDWTVFYLSLEDPVGRYMDQLTSTLNNIRHRRLSIVDIFDDTVIFNWYLSGIWTSSPYKVMHLSDALRLALLWKYAGVYVDLDVVVLGSFDGVRNSVSRELFPDVGNAVMTFEKGHPFLLHCMREFAAGYRSLDYPHNGPRLLDRVLCELCTEEVFYNEDSFDCAGVRVLESRAFFPVSYPEWQRPFFTKDADGVLTDCKNSTVIHLWNSLSHAASIEPGSAYDTWQRVLCPTTYQEMSYIGPELF